MAINPILLSNQNTGASKAAIPNSSDLQARPRVESENQESFSNVIPQASEHLREHLSSLRQQYGSRLFESVVITDRFGTVVAQTGDEEKLSYEKEEWWQITKENGNYLSEILGDQQVTYRSIYHSFSIFDQEQRFIGALRIRLNLSEIQNIIEGASKKLSKTAENEIYLLTQNNSLIYKTNPLIIFSENQMKKALASFSGKEVNSRSNGSLMRWSKDSESETLNILAPMDLTPVSYTHLTLPTICSV